MQAQSRPRIFPLTRTAPIDPAPALARDVVIHPPDIVGALAGCRPQARETAMKRMILVALVLACGGVQASVWVPIGNTAKEANVTVDISSLTIVNGDVRSVWWKIVHQKHTVKGSGRNADKWEEFSLFHSAFNCSEATSKVDAARVYFEDGTTYAPQAEWWSKQTFQPVVPDAAMEAVMKFVCTWKPE
jgi:hypothetical protein